MSAVQEVAPTITMTWEHRLFLESQFAGGAVALDHLLPQPDPWAEMGTYGAVWSADFSWRPAAEKQKSFDPAASLRMFQYDLDTVGYIRHETKERVCDEELSLLAEGVDRASCTDFKLKRIGDDLMYRKGGKWASYTGMLLIGNEVAQLEAQLDPRRQFLANDAVRDLGFGYKMRDLKPGQRLVWAMPYPHDVEERYGAGFAQECGRFTDRKMGFICYAYCNADGDVVLFSQTVDRSDDKALAKVIDYAGEGEFEGMGDLLQVYDAELSRKLGGEFFAGRRNAELQENAWKTILEQRDLIEYFLAQLEVIARNPNRGEGLDRAAKRHMYGVWAAFKKRLDGETRAVIRQAERGMPMAYYAMVAQQVESAFVEFAREGKPMLGCGGSIKMLQGEDDILNASPQDVYKAIFGEGSGDDSDTDCAYVSRQCPMPNCGKKNVWTVDKRIVGRLRRITGSCGCTKEYVKAPVVTKRSNLAPAV